jgi:putative ABC transport system permease protein
VNLLTLSLAGMRDYRLTHFLNILILGTGLGTVTLLLLFSNALTERLTRDVRGIDLVVGAKGSPLQLVLSAVFAADVPTGNILLTEAETLQHNPMVDRSVPIALGDSAGSFRIVGTIPDYLSLYGATLATGSVWQQPLEVVLGAEAARRLHLKLGDQLIGAHGVNGGGELHKRYPYTVTGILDPTGSVIDRLIMTSIDSVWKVHEDETPPGQPREVTAVLLHARTPLAVVVLPHQINTTTSMMAAVPSIEAARLFSLLGVEFDAFHVLAWVLIASASMGTMITLITRLRERRQEMAVLRLLGASRGQLFATVLIEAIFLAAAGALAGLVLGHLIAWVLAHWMPPGQVFAQLDAGLAPSEWQIPVLALGVGVIAAIIPALTAYRGNVADALVNTQG